MSESYKKLIKTLKTIFEMDKADLDFGIYRIMNQKRDDINAFLENDLLPQVKEAFAEYASEGNSGALAELDTLIKTLTDAGMNPDESPKVQALKEQLKGIVDSTALENDVFSKLHTFFSRYYDKGDFISQRRYKADTYAIPYEGEEVKLYWANHDQYYIKSSEHLRDYAFLASQEGAIDGQKSVRIKLVEADAEKDNVKAKKDEERKFILDEAHPLSLENGELLIHFNYVPAGKQKQEKLNEVAVETIFAQEGFDEWLNVLKAPASTESKPNRTLLERHLNEYTARNTFDYFIHKDLGGFLNRELDFFIKNEVMFLDDIEDASFIVTEQLLKKVKIIRSIAKKVIRMLAQLENFQKKLWLKKKFVVESNYIISLKLIEFNKKIVDEIFSSKKQLKEWVDLLSIDIKRLKNDYDSLSWEEFLDLNYVSSLHIDTKNFNVDFVNDVLSCFENISELESGVVVNADNFHGISTLKSQYERSLSAIYIDPPYNTNSTPILYKNEYKDSSWMSLIRDRVALSKGLLKEDGVQIVAIDDTELSNLSKILEAEYSEHRHSRISIIHNPKGSITKDFNRVHEYALFVTPSTKKGVIARTLEENDTPRKMRRWGENSLRTERKLSFYPIYIRDGEIVRVGEVPDDDFHPDGRNVHLENGEVEVWPIDQNSIERRWNFGLDSINENLSRILPIESSGLIDLFVTHELTVPKTVWGGGDYDAGKYGNSLLIDILGEKRFDFPKSINTVERCIYLATSNQKEAVVLDYFAGSGTTAHAIMKLNDKDGGRRKFLLVEMGKHFDTVVLPRIKKIAYSRHWGSGSPILESEEKLPPILVKYLRLESYEDTLNNLVLTSNESQQNIFNSSKNEELFEDYMLGYWLDVETTESPSLLNIDQFEDPFNYKLNIGSGSVAATKATTVDLVETFNYLIGLTVKTIDVIKGFKVVTGTNPQGDSVLVVWRNVKENDNDALETFLDKQGYNPRDTEFYRIYVNGDHTLEDPQHKVKMTEIEFKRLMFDVSDV